MDLDIEQLRQGLIAFLIVVSSLALHEWGHAAMADRLGDPTPRNEGRVTLNPLAHIDWIGTILIPLLGVLGFFGGFAMIGWAKPVYTNPSYFRRGYFDQALVTIAGPGMNFALAVVFTVFAALTERFLPGVTELCFTVVTINVALMVFNLLPIPPLDGSKFLMYWFGMSEEAYNRFSAMGGLILLVCINIPAFRQLLGNLISGALIPFIFLFKLLT